MIPADLDPIFTTLPPELVSAQQAAGLQATLGLFPRAPVEVFGLECRLHDDAQVDMGIGLNQHSFGSFPFDDPGACSPEWGRIAALAQRSTRVGSAIMGMLSRVWLEFDDAGAGPSEARVPTSAIVVNVDGFPEACVVETERELLIGEVLAPLVGGAVALDTFDLVRRCFSELPPTPAHVSNVGVFLSRGSSIRVCVSNLRDEQIAPYLARLGWIGDHDALTRILAGTAAARAISPFPSFLLHLDVHERLRPSVGLEFIFERRVQLAGTIVEVGLLDLLVDQGACLPSKRAALQRWPGHALELRADGTEHLQIRRLNSVKLVCSSEGATRAKAYLVVLNIASSRSAPEPAEDPQRRVTQSS